MIVLCDYCVVSSVSRRVGAYAAVATTTADSVSCCFPFLLSPTSLPIVAQTRGLHKLVGLYFSFMQSMAVVCTRSECG